MCCIFFIRLFHSLFYRMYPFTISSMKREVNMDYLDKNFRVRIRGLITLLLVSNSHKRPVYRPLIKQIQAISTPDSRARPFIKQKIAFWFKNAMKIHIIEGFTNDKSALTYHLVAPSSNKITLTRFWTMAWFGCFLLGGGGQSFNMIPKVYQVT